MKNIDRKPEDERVEPRRPAASGMPRRTFLHMGALGLAATATGLPTAEQDDAGDPETTETQPVAPSAADRIDPASLSTETWHEPFTWRPADWPGESLHLNVVQPGNPGPVHSVGNPYPIQFSYGGISPGPTIRVRADGEVRIKVRNLLDMNSGIVPVGPCADPVDVPPSIRSEYCQRIAERDGTDPEQCGFFDGPLNPTETFQAIPAKVVPNFAVMGHVNGLHAAHVTNLHTHGLHVNPGMNPDGTASDNVMIRIIPRGDREARRATGDPDIDRLMPNERVAEQDYVFHLAKKGAGEVGPTPHPPGTHWYHPHAHGATHDQVASGMAGFLVVEGDVDEAINRVMTGESWPDPGAATGPFDYRERLVFIQRVEVSPNDLDGRGQRRTRQFPIAAPDAAPPPPVLFMRPGAVERWRVLNGSVDGRGFKRIMVLRGEFVFEEGRTWKLVRTEGEPVQRIPVSRQEMEDAKLGIYQLSADGLTLVTTRDGKARHTIRDLSKRNAGTINPMNQAVRDGVEGFPDWLRNVEDCFRDGDAIRRCFVRPNELYLATANRADIFFRAPASEPSNVLTLYAQEVFVHTDNFQERIQLSIRRAQASFLAPPRDVVVAYVHLRGDPVAQGDFDVMSLEDYLPEVPAFLQPIGEDELRVGRDEANVRGIPTDSYRTRVLSYSGYGSADFPLVLVPDEFAESRPDLEKLTWARHDGYNVLLPNLTKTMAINPRFDLLNHPDPDSPRKFAPHDPKGPKVLVNTAEEWVLYNTSVTLWAHKNRRGFPQPGSWPGRFVSYPIPRAEGQRRHAEDPDFLIHTKGADHPFHIHINPMWVIRIEIPDENGHLHNILEEPCWMDTVSIPRNGGRVIFRSRFQTHIGKWVNHCHMLQHEDNGMMQIVESSDDPRFADYSARSSVASPAASEEEVNAIYPRPTLEQCYRQSMSFVDASVEPVYEYPGFELVAPRLESE